MNVEAQPEAGALEEGGERFGGGGPSRSSTRCSVGSVGSLNGYCAALAAWHSAKTVAQTHACREASARYARMACSVTGIWPARASNYYYY